MPSQPRRVSKQGGAATDEMASVAVPDKVRGHIGIVLNAFVLWCRAISSYTIACHLLCATVATPLRIKGGPRHTERGFRLLDHARIVASSKAQEHIYPDKQDYGITHLCGPNLGKIPCVLTARPALRAANPPPNVEGIIVTS